MRRVTTISILAAVLLGVVIGVVLMPAWRRARALDAIADVDRTVRDRGWAWLTAPTADGHAIRAARLLEEIDKRLANAGDDAVHHAADALGDHGLWGWSHQDRPLLVRAIAIDAGRPDAGSRWRAVELMERCPLDLDPSAAMELFARLLDDDAADRVHRVFAAACGFAGRDRVDLLEPLPLPADDIRLHRLRHLALSWGRPPPAPGPVAPDLPLDVREAQLLRRVLADPGDASVVLEHAAARDDAPRPPLASILRYSRDPRATRVLDDRARDGDHAARYALQTRLPREEQTQARAVVLDEEHPASIRRLAAWRWDAVSEEQVIELLGEGATEPDGSVYATALLAERRLGPASGGALAARWIRSFDDDEKRAGALTAALLGGHGDLLFEAYELEDVADVRTIQRLALWALRQPVGDEDPVEFAHRVSHGDHGDFAADTALCLLLAGHADALALLTTPPPAGWGDSGQAIQRRSWLIERFVPTWHDIVGRPIGGDVRGIDLYFDHLEALRLLTRRRLRFEVGQGIYTEAVAVPAVDG